MGILFLCATFSDTKLILTDIVLRPSVCFWRDSPPVGQGLLIHEISRSHSDTPHSVGLLWTSDQLVSETSTVLNTQHSTQTSMPSVGNEPTASACERPQTYAIDRAATGTGVPHPLDRINTRIVLQK
jgi:hypothetical protein